MVEVEVEQIILLPCHIQNLLLNMLLFLLYVLFFIFICKFGITLIFVHHMRLILYLDILHHLDLQLPLCHMRNLLLNMLLFLL